MNIKNCKSALARGTSLLEVIFAAMLLLIAIIPIYKALSTGAAQELETTKISMARKVLDSLKNEALATPFHEVQGFFSGTQEFSDIGEVGFSVTRDQVLQNQKKFKDFTLRVLMRYTNSAKSIIECKGIVEWTSDQKKTKSEELVFLHVMP